MRAPELAVGEDGALGFWGALGDAFPETRCQRDRVHKTTNVLDRMPRNVHRRAKAAIHEVTRAEGRAEARKAVGAFSEGIGVKWPKAVAKIEDDEEALLAFYDFPAEHIGCISSEDRPDRVHLRAGEGEDGRDEGARVEGGGLGDDLQARGSRRGEVEEAQPPSSCGVLVRAGARFVNGEPLEGSEEKVAA